MADKAAPSEAFGLHPFENIAAQPLDSWKPVSDEPPPPMSSSSHDGLPRYPKMVSRELIQSTIGYLGGSNPYNIVIS
jgi:hypothetical protein